MQEIPVFFVVQWFCFWFVVLFSLKVLLAFVSDVLINPVKLF